MPNKYILVVTSNSELGHLLVSSVLRPANYEVTLAKDAQTAEAAFRSYPPDLTIIDLNARDGVGGDFVERLLDRLPIMPVVLIASKDRPEALKQALELGAADCIFPPLKPEIILKTVDRNLARRERLEKWSTRRSREQTDTLLRRLDVLETLQQVGRSVTASLDLDQVLKEVVDTAVHMT